MQGKMLGGEGRSPHDYERDTQEWVDAKGRRAQQKAHDQAHREKTAMRRARIEKLEELGRSGAA